MCIVCELKEIKDKLPEGAMEKIEALALCNYYLACALEEIDPDEITPRAKAFLDAAHMCREEYQAETKEPKFDNSVLDKFFGAMKGVTVIKAKPGESLDEAMERFFNQPKKDKRNEH